MSTDDALDQLRAALAEPRNPHARSYDPRKPHLATAAREAYVARQEHDDGAFYYEHIAEGHRRKAAAADTPAERDHWLLEAERFEELASMARIDPAAARRRYRPTRSYEA